MSSVGDVIPVIIGTYYNAYGMLRAFYEDGMRAVLVSDGRPSFVSRSRFASRHVVITNASSDEEAFVDGLLELGRELFPARGMLFPTHDEQLIAIAASAERLSEFYEIPFSDYELLMKIIDKASFNELCARIGIPTAKAVEAHSREDAAAAWEKLRFPVIIKANNPAGVLAKAMPGGKHVAYDTGEYDELMDVIYAADEASDLLIQDYIPESGKLMPTVNSVADRSGELKCVFVYDKLRQYPVMTGTSTAARICRAEDEEYAEIIEYTGRIAAECGYYGLLGVEYKYDPVDGNYKVIEMNCRSEFPNYLQLVAGQNMPAYLYRYHLGEDCEIDYYPQRDRASCYLPFLDRYYACSLNRRFAPEFCMTGAERRKTLSPPATRYGLTLSDPLAFVSAYAAAIRAGLAEGYRKRRGIPGNVSIGEYIKKRGRI